ncbi:oxidoreductase-like protein [Parachaetomium inaequale]|uniref:Oxidoreductase-like protein n=1 Tax=Parachaetomium inaequale TaxID=2588326 RepID=A0AAN6SNR7_9PEZI|nr:oxidoreductase-like protein [Parachaetomium inaequale]
MRRTFLSARPARAVYRALGSQQPRRTFATPPIKADSPPSPIEPSKEQAHPVGPFYEAILRTPAPLPEKKPEEPPVTSQASPAQPPKPTPEQQQQPSKPADEAKPAAPAAEDKPSPQPAAEDKKPARRPRKPRQPAAETTAPKTKSVPSSSSSSASLDSFPPSPGPTLLPQSPPPPPNQTSNPSPEEEAQAQEENPPSNALQARARIVFGASLAGPAERAERLARLRSDSRLVAGVLVPPKPDEPDNCCMSGCVNCVWDRYRDEMEAWAEGNAEAERRLAAAGVGAAVGVTEECMEGVGHDVDLGVHDADVDRGAVGVDDDGGGSVGNWEASSAPAGVNRDGGGRVAAAKAFWDEELYKNVPVGIREFMKQEKRLKEKHLREGTVGG